MQFDFTTMKPMDRYEFLLGTVLPRPITIVTTLSGAGALNAAPYSLFNVVGHDPPVIMIAVLPHPEGRLERILPTTFSSRAKFVREPRRRNRWAEAMNITCIDSAGRGMNLNSWGLETTPSVTIKPPRIARKSGRVRVPPAHFAVVRAEPGR